MSATKAGAILDTLKPQDDTPMPGVTSKLVPKGATLATPTLGGYCASKSRTDKARVARRQWVFLQDGKSVGASVEVTAYATSAQARAAYNEFVAMTAACSQVTLRTARGTATYNRYTVTDESPSSDIRAQMSIIREDVVIAATQQTRHQWLTGTVQQRGQFLAIVWTEKSAKYTGADLAIIRSIVDTEAVMLGTTPLS